MGHIQNPIIVKSEIFSQIVAYLEPCITLAYSEPCHIQNPGIFRTRDTLRILPRHILAYSEGCVTCHIQNFGKFRTRAYSESCLFRHIPKYSITIVIITLPFFFFHFNLTYFSKKFKKAFTF